jgi:hypothetical protein
MPVTINGNDITMTGVTLTLVNAANPDSGVSYIIITPEGGVGAIPFMAQGLPGQATLFPVITYVQLTAGTALPVPNPEVTLLDAGGAGLPAKYSLKFYGNAGPTGATGSPSISGASDLAAAPVLGVLTDKYNLIFDNATSKFIPTAQKVGNIWTATNIVLTAFNNTSPRLLSTITITPPPPFDYRVIPSASSVITGSIDTRVDLVVRISDPASGAQVGLGKGMTGVNAAGIPTTVNFGHPAGSAVPGSYAKVTAGNSVSVYLRAEQKAGSSNSWSTPASPDTTFDVMVLPLL